jgi:hypothetical protein
MDFFRGRRLSNSKARVCSPSVATKSTLPPGTGYSRVTFHPDRLRMISQASWKSAARLPLAPITKRSSNGRSHQGPDSHTREGSLFIYSASPISSFPVSSQYCRAAMRFSAPCLSRCILVLRRTPSGMGYGTHPTVSSVLTP